MNVNDIPPQCLQDPQFVNVCVASLCSQKVKSEKLIEDGEQELKELKATVIDELNHRKKLKKQIQENQDTIAVLEPALQSLRDTEKDLNEKLNEVKASLDTDQQKTELEKKAYIEILESYKSTWQQYKIEYEKMPGAVKRKEAQINLKKLEIQLMVGEFKKNELDKIVAQRRLINNRRIQLKIVELSGMLLKRFNRQKYHLERIQEIKLLNEKLYKLREHYNCLIKKNEEKEKIRLLARQQMPPPRLDIGSFARTFCTSQTSNYQLIEQKRKNLNYERDSDTVSINSVMFEEMCKNDDDNLTITSPVIQSTPDNQEKKSVSPVLNSVNDTNIGTLETYYRQLSIEKKNNSSIEPETPKKVTSPDKITEVISHEKRSPSPETLKQNQQDEPELKKQKLMKSVEINNEEIIKIDNPTRSMPQIKKVERVNHPIMKNHTIEKTPMLSDLFSPHHYAMSDISSATNMTTTNYSNYDSTRANYEKNEKINYPNSPVQSWMGDVSPVHSQASFMSDISAIKNINKKDESTDDNDDKQIPDNL
ncbi:DNA repair protein RAD50-like [Aphidius gifuensis]|uniref:DNA repair protein RAD50-like n=1 Tax=Aphidius gifuensis TaxID=684658 RepID=UPI001CDCFB52|nr:DNA repair protein RAD50-like [Aphidius gifuensis]